MYSDAQIEKALREADGQITYAAEALGCAFNTIKRRLQKSKRLQELKEELDLRIVEKPAKTLMVALDRVDNTGLPDGLAIAAAEKILRLHPTARALGYGINSQEHKVSFDETVSKLDKIGAKIGGLDES